MKDVRVIEVRIWDQRVGAVALDPRLGYYAFAYEPAWRRTGIELAPLTLPLDNRSTAFVFPNLPEATFHRMPGMLADALPDDFGNAPTVWRSERRPRHDPHPHSVERFLHDAMVEQVILTEGQIGGNGARGYPGARGGNQKILDASFQRP